MPNCNVEKASENALKPNLMDKKKEIWAGDAKSENILRTMEVF